MTPSPLQCIVDALGRLTAADVMTTDAITLAESESLAAAWELLARSGCRVLPVVRNGRVVGVIDDHAIVCARSTKFLDGSQRLVGDTLVPAHTVQRSTKVRALLDRLADGADRALVVLDDHGFLVGLVTADRLVTLLQRALVGDPSVADLVARAASS
jgi:CBS-domain-containing membrane protein